MAEISTALRSAYFLKMIRYGPTFLRSRPFHSAPCKAFMLLHWESSFSSNSSMACSIRSRMSRGNRKSRFWASRESSTRKRMFDDAPGFRLSTFELRLTAADNFRFRGRQGVIGINHAFRFYKYAVLLLGERHEIPRLELEGFEDLSWNHHLRRCPTRPILSWVAVVFMAGNTSGFEVRFQCKGMRGFRQTFTSAPVNVRPLRGPLCNRLNKGFRGSGKCRK